MPPNCWKRNSRKRFAKPKKRPIPASPSATLISTRVDKRERAGFEIAGVCLGNPCHSAILNPSAVRNLVLWPPRAPQIPRSARNDKLFKAFTTKIPTGAERVGHLVWEPSDEHGPIRMFSMSRPLLLGHRGARSTRSIPENTLASFDLAREHGCDGFEFDVRQTGDGRCVICHDPEIQGIEIARAGTEDLADLPVLEQVLARYRERAFLDIEIKVPDIENAVIQCLRIHPPQRGYVISSFLPEVLLN